MLIEDDPVAPFGITGQGARLGLTADRAASL